jgi:hypothetical protein
VALLMLDGFSYRKIAAIVVRAARRRAKEDVLRRKRRLEALLKELDAP